MGGAMGRTVPLAGNVPAAVRCRNIAGEGTVRPIAPPMKMDFFDEN